MAWSFRGFIPWLAGFRTEASWWKDVVEKNLWFVAGRMQRREQHQRGESHTAHIDPKTMQPRFTQIPKGMLH